jgi:uncharacterized protein (TIGR02147 family)
MQIFEYQDYKEFVRDRVRGMPSRGKGQFQKLSKQLKLHPSVTSQVFRGSRQLTSDQAVELAHFLGLEARETDYLVGLVHLAQARTDTLRALIRRQLLKIAQEGLASDPAPLVPPKAILDERGWATFYSQW